MAWTKAWPALGRYFLQRERDALLHPPVSLPLDRQQVEVVQQLALVADHLQLHRQQVPEARHHHPGDWKQRLETQVRAGAVGQDGRQFPGCSSRPRARRWAQAARRGSRFLVPVAFRMALGGSRCTIPGMGLGVVGAQDPVGYQAGVPVRVQGVEVLVPEQMRQPPWEPIPGLAWRLGGGRGVPRRRSYPRSGARPLRPSGRSRPPRHAPRLRPPDRLLRDVTLLNEPAQRTPSRYRPTSPPAPQPSPTEARTAAAPARPVPARPPWSALGSSV